MTFKEWLLAETRTATKLGLYPDLYDIVGQYPPIYSTATSADYIYYYDRYYGPKGVPGKNGTHWYAGMRAQKSSTLPPE